MHTLAEAEIPVSYLTGYGKFVAASDAAAREKHGAAGRPVPGLLGPGTVAWPVPGGRRRQDRQPEDAVDAVAAVASARPLEPGTVRRSGSPSLRRPDRARIGRTRGRTHPIPRWPGQTYPEAPPLRGSDEPAAREMAELLARVPHAPDLGVLLGLEGQAAALYFANFGRMLKVQGPGHRFRLHDEEPPPAPRPGECPA